MHLMDVLALRPVPAAALFLALTRRCPLSCAHCSTNSMLTSEEHPGDMYLRFVETFTPDDHPEVILMSGGEALLRPRLVRDLAESARAVGCSAQVLSGMFFARNGRRIPRPLVQAIEAVDHFSASLDAFHEREVSRTQVFRALDEVLSLGKDVSLHLVGLGDDDPYIEGLVADVRRRFDDRVPVLVGRVGATGRARDWLEEEPTAPSHAVAADPCAIANWPLVAFDGTIVACCNQDVVDRRPVPAHLRLGHAAEDDWPSIRAAYVRSTLLRGVRLFGPQYVADRFGERAACEGYCETCFGLPDDEALERRVAEVLARSTTELLEQQVAGLQREAGPLAYARRFGVARYADLITLGYQPDAAWVA